MKLAILHFAIAIGCYGVLLWAAVAWLDETSGLQQGLVIGTLMLGGLLNSFVGAFRLYSVIRKGQTASHD